MEQADGLEARRRLHAIEAASFAHAPEGDRRRLKRELLAKIEAADMHPELQRQREAAEEEEYRRNREELRAMLGSAKDKPGTKLGVKRRR